MKKIEELLKEYGVHHANDELDKASITELVIEYAEQIVEEIKSEIQKEILSIGEISHNSIAAIRQNATISAYRGAIQICSVVKDEIQ